MPGASLWLLPPANDPATRLLTEIIARDIPVLLDKDALSFAPHVTLTSDIDLSGIENPQRWLQELIESQWFDNTDPVIVKFEEVDTAQRFTKKVFIRCQKKGAQSASSLKLAAICRHISELCDSEAEAEGWAINEWDPHVSLLYSAIDPSSINIEKVTQALTSRGVALGQRPTAEMPSVAGWSGGRIWLVDTSKVINEWAPIAAIDL